MRNSKAKATRRKRVAPRLSAKAIAPQPTQEAQELPLELFLEDDELSAPLDEAVGATPQWNGMDIHVNSVREEPLNRILGICGWLTSQCRDANMRRITAERL